MPEQRRLLTLDRWLVTIASAASLSVIAAPINLHWLHWIAFVPFFWVLREETPRQNVRFGLLYGFVAVATIFRWIVETIVLFSNLPLAVALLALVLFSLVFGLPYVALWAGVHPLRRRLGSGWILAFPALLVVIEYLTMYVLLFPYNQGISQYRNPFTWQLVSVTGVWGASWLVMFVNCTLAEGIYRRREGRPFPVRWVAAAVALLSAVVVWGGWRYARVEAALQEAPVLKVGLIQTSKTMTHRFSESRKRALQDWVDETAALVEATEPGDVDLVIWSEGASPYNVHTGTVKEGLSRLARAGGFELLVGGGTVERHEEGGEKWIEAYNSVYLFGKGGEIAGRYDKTVPLPFGEYLPLSGIFPFLNDWIRGPGDFRAGSVTNVLEGSHRIAAPICYEAILPSVCRRFPEPDLIVNVTNDAWFGTSAAADQHAMLATARAVELGVPLVREGYTGISMVVEPHGRIFGETAPFERRNFVVRVRMADLPTLYARWGDWFVWLCLGGLVLGWAVAPWRRGPPTVPPELLEPPDEEGIVSAE